MKLIMKHTDGKIGIFVDDILLASFECVGGPEGNPAFNSFYSGLINQGVHSLYDANNDWYVVSNGE